MEDNITLTINELQIVAELDSRLFGFLKLNDEVNVVKKAAANKAILYLERVLVQANIQVINHSLINKYVIDYKNVVFFL